MYQGEGDRKLLSVRRLLVRFLLPPPLALPIWGSLQRICLHLHNRYFASERDDRTLGAQDPSTAPGLRTLRPLTAFTKTPRTPNVSKICPAIAVEGSIQRE